MKKILIIGARGFLGKRIKIKLEKKHKIISPRKCNNFNISNINFLQRYIKEDLDIIINLSGQKSNSKNMYSAIVNGNSNLIKLVSKLKKKVLVIYFSTSLVYGYSSRSNKENSKLKPDSEYAKYKLLAEKYYRKSNINYLILRISNVYNDFKNNKGIISKIYNSMRLNNKLVITNKNAYRNFISLDDLIVVIDKILSSNLKRKLYNIGNENLKLKDIIMEFEQLYKTKINFEDKKIELKKISSQKIDVKRYQLDFKIKPKYKLYNFINDYKKKNKFKVFKK